MCAHHMCELVAHGGQKRVSDPLKRVTDLCATMWVMGIKPGSHVEPYLQSPLGCFYQNGLSHKQEKKQAFRFTETINEWMNE